MVDWILKRNAKQWANVIETIQLRTLLNEKQMVGSVKTQFEYNREALIGGNSRCFSLFTFLARYFERYFRGFYLIFYVDLGVSARKIINTFDKKVESDRLTGSIRTSIAQTAAIEVRTYFDSLIYQIPNLRLVEIIPSLGWCTWNRRSPLEFIFRYQWHSSCFRCRRDGSWCSPLHALQTQGMSLL